MQLINAPKLEQKSPPHYIDYSLQQRPGSSGVGAFGSCYVKTLGWRADGSLSLVLPPHTNFQLYGRVARMMVTF